MSRLEFCPNCDQEVNDVLAFAILAPWISELANLGHESKFSRLMKCNSCDFQFYSNRFSESIMAAIYSGYRGEQYFQVRSKWEPWYSRKIMNAWNPEENSFGVTSRKRHLLEILNDSNIELGKLRNVLDFGGDLGQFFPEEIPGLKYLYDPSQPPLQFHDIERVQNLDGLVNQIGLVMNSHTLEHLPHFRSDLENLAQLLSPAGVLYLEVPMDAFRIHRFHSTKYYSFYLRAAIGVPKIFILLDFLTGIYRTIFRKIPLWGIVKQSEHINYFSKLSLQNLAKNTGFEIVKITEPDYTFGQGAIKLGRISMVLKNH